MQKIDEASKGNPDPEAERVQEFLM